MAKVEVWLLPTALATSDTSAPVDSQIADMALMLEILWARKAFAANFDSSEDHVSMVRMFPSSGNDVIEIKSMTCSVSNLRESNACTPKPAIGSLGGHPWLDHHQ